MKLFLNIDDIIINQRKDEFFIYCVHSEKIYKLNSTAKFIVQTLKERGALTLDELLNHFELKFNGPNHLEIKNFINELTTANIIQQDL